MLWADPASHRRSETACPENYGCGFQCRRDPGFWIGSTLAGHRVYVPKAEKSLKGTELPYHPKGIEGEPGPTIFQQQL